MMTMLTKTLITFQLLYAHHSTTNNRCCNSFLIGRPSATTSSSFSSLHSVVIPNQSEIDQEKEPIEENSTSSTSSEKYEKFFQHAKNEHDDQFYYGSQTFGTSSSSDSTTSTTSSGGNHIWTDEDFTTYQVKKGYAGPSESILQNGNIIYETKNPILDEEECQDFIQAAQQTIQNERDEQEAAVAAAESETGSPESAASTQRSNADLGEARLSNLPPQTLQKIKSMLETKLYPALISRFGINDLTVYDGLIIGHIAPSASQPVHRDASLLTLNIPLSSPGIDYNGGGGVYVEGLENHDDNGLPLLLEKGKALCHSSGIMHAGIGIQQGQRWVMVLFLIAKHEPQIARRCHADGLFAMNEQKLEEAMEAFEAGLSKAPNDHLLHMGIGQIASIYSNNPNLDIPHHKRKEMDQLSTQCLDKASKLYPPSLKANIALGKMLLGRRKPRAALRRFDYVLKEIDDKDLIPGAFMQLKAQAWDTRVCAARCALMCVEYMVEKNKDNTNEKHENDGLNVWSNKLRLEEAIERMKLAMIPVPNDQNLQFMKSRAEEILEYISHD
jgi:tetratricopeptide (TPR) repeat protein